MVTLPTRNGDAGQSLPLTSPTACADTHHRKTTGTAGPVLAASPSCCVGATAAITGPGSPVWRDEGQGVSVPSTTTSAALK